MAEFYAGGIVYEIRVDDKSGIGIKKAEGNIKGFEHTTEKTDIKIKSLTKDSAVLGSSFQALGGSAMIAGTAIGGPLGESLQSSGMGLSFLGTGLATVVPAMRGLSVMVDGTLIPALIRLNAFLGPTGWIVIGIAAATAAIGTFVYFQNQAKDSLNDTSLSAEDAKKNIEGLNEAMRERARLEKELAGLPVKEEELKFELAGAKLDERAAYARVQKLYEEGVTGLDLEQAGYSFLTAERRRKRIEAQILALSEIGPAYKAATLETSRWQAATSLGVPYEMATALHAGEPSQIGAAGAPFQTLVIQINGTVTDQTFTIPGESLKDRVSNAGYGIGVSN